MTTQSVTHDRIITINLSISSSVCVVLNCALRFFDVNYTSVNQACIHFHCWSTCKRPVWKSEQLVAPIIMPSAFVITKSLNVAYRRPRGGRGDICMLYGARLFCSSSQLASIVHTNAEFFFFLPRIPDLILAHFQNTLPWLLNMYVSLNLLIFTRATLC